ncbi:MAG: DUF305 domain-containing protein [Nostocaceae cyanobacterium]|nr:DUF305 domain-containing protein [Nostocaceae cyanobacterium]
MKHNPLLYGIIGFILGGLVVSIAATTFDKPKTAAPATSGISMSQMTASLKTKSGDDFDKAFIADMIAHHQSAIDMAKLSATNAKHQEVKDLSNNIISTQQKEITEMTDWQTQWDYTDHSMMNMPGMH